MQLSINALLNQCCLCRQSQYSVVSILLYFMKSSLMSRFGRAGGVNSHGGARSRIASYDVMNLARRALVRAALDGRDDVVSATSSRSLSRLYANGLTSYGQGMHSTSACDSQKTVRVRYKPNQIYLWPIILGIREEIPPLDPGEAINFSGKSVNSQGLYFPLFYLQNR